MFRVITSGTHRRYTQAAGRVSGLETELTDARDKLATYRAWHEDDQKLLKQLEGERRQSAGRATELEQRCRSLEAERNTLHLALEAIAAALVKAESAEDARQEAARLVLRHGDRAVLGALVADLDLLSRGPVVHLYLRRGGIRSAHTTYGAAQRAAERDGAHPSGWLPRRTLESARDTGPLTDYSVRSLPVRGAWPDRGRVYLLVREDGRPFTAHGTAQAAADFARSPHASGPALTATEVAVAATRPTAAPV